LYKNFSIQKTTKNFNQKGKAKTFIDVAANIAKSSSKSDLSTPDPFVSTESVITNLRQINKTN